jgi:HK97 family phage major capsid protein
MEKELEKKEEEVKETPEVEEKSVVKDLEALVDKASGNLRSEVSEALKKQVAEIKRQMENGVGNYNKEIQEDTKRKALNVKMRETVGAIMANDIDKLKEMTTDADSSPYAGYAVDSELSAEIRHLMTEYGVARRESLTLQLSKNSYKANDLVTDLSVYWVDEGTAISSSQVVLGQETLELKKLGVIASLTSELLEDSEIDLFGFIAGRVAEGFAKAEDQAFFIGDGTSTYGNFTGLLNNASVNEVTMTGTTFASVDADDFIDMVDATHQGALANAKYYLHRTIMSYVRKLQDDNGQYIYQAPSAQGPATIWGYPVVLVEAMPDKNDSAADTSFVLFGDLKKATIFGYKGSIVAKRFDAGTVKDIAGTGTINLITTDREAIRWTERFGFIVIIPTAVTKLTTASASA